MLYVIETLQPGLRPPGMLALADGRVDVEEEIDVLGYLEVIHPDAQEIGAVFERLREPDVLVDGAGRQNLESDPKLFELFHKGGGLGGLLASDVVVMQLRRG